MKGNWELGVLAFVAVIIIGWAFGVDFTERYEGTGLTLSAAIFMGLSAYTGPCQREAE